MSQGVEGNLGWVPLNMGHGLANSHEDINANLEYIMQRPYTGLPEILGTESGAVSVVGSGPSLKKNWKKLRDSDTDIIACNAAFQFLLERGVTPKYFFCFDADPLMLEFITPHPDVIYLMGSRCPPRAFQMLEGCNVIVWHAKGDRDLELLLNKYGRMEPMVAGGTAAVTRAMTLAQPLGYTTVHLWGCDSSWSEGATHIRKSTTDEKYIPIRIQERVFHTAPWMCQQVEDFKQLAPAIRDMYGVKFIVHGDGMMPFIAEIMDFETDSPKIARAFRSVKRKARILWSQL